MTTLFDIETTRPAERESFEVSFADALMDFEACDIELPPDVELLQELGASEVRDILDTEPSPPVVPAGTIFCGKILDGEYVVTDLRMAGNRLRSARIHRLSTTPITKGRDYKGRLVLLDGFGEGIEAKRWLEAPIIITE